MHKVTIMVDDQEIRVQKGLSLLEALLQAGIFVPHLCFMKGVDPPHGGCRLCWVHVEGKEKPVTSCSVLVEEGLQVKTRTPEVDRLVTSAFELLMSTHRLDCKVCPNNRSCALQTIAEKRKLPLTPKRFSKLEPDHPIDESRTEIGINPNHCVLCGKCVWVCNVEVKKGILAETFRGLKVVVRTFDGKPLAEQGCGTCVRCAEVCPVGAIYFRKDSKQ